MRVGRGVAPPFVPLILSTAVAVFGCYRGAAPGDVLVDIRNLSPGAISIETVEPGLFILADVHRHTIEPWQEGQCFAHLGFGPGHLEVRVSGSNIVGTRAYSITTPVPVGTPIHVGVQVAADGEVQFGGTFPEDPVPCEGGGY